MCGKVSVRLSVCMSQKIGLLSIEVLFTLEFLTFYIKKKLILRAKKET